MELPILFFFISLIFCWFFIKSLILTSKSTWNNLPPGPIGLPIIGSLLELGSRPNQSLAELAKIHGPLMTLKLGSITTIIASSPETAKEILQKHDKTFSARTVPDAVASQPNPEATSAWVPTDNMWRNKRRLLNTQMFNNQRLDLLQELRHEKAEQLVSHIRSQCETGSAVDIGRVAFATTLNLISNTIFSMDMVDPEFKRAHEFKELVWTIMEDAGVPNLSDYFPVLKWLDLQGVRRRIRPAYLRLHEIFEQQIEKRVQARAAGMNKKGDFLDILLDQCEDEGSEFDRKTIKPLIVTLSFDVFKLDFINDDHVEFQYLDGILGNRAFFVGSNIDFALSTTQFPELRPDSIYFTDDQIWAYRHRKKLNSGGHDLGIYDCKEGSFSSCYYPIDLDRIQKILPAPIWFTPFTPDVHVAKYLA